MSRLDRNEKHMGAQAFHQHIILDEFQSLGAFPHIIQGEFPGLDTNVFFTLVFKMGSHPSCAFT